MCAGVCLRVRVDERSLREIFGSQVREGNGKIFLLMSTRPHTRVVCFPFLPPRKGFWGVFPSAYSAKHISFEKKANRALLGV